MDSRGAPRMLTVIAANVGITLGLLTTIELTCRLWEYRANANRQQNAVKPAALAAKAGSELRIFTFGGSTVYGVPVPEVGFVAQLRYWFQRLYPARNIRIY